MYFLKTLTTALAAVGMVSVATTALASPPSGPRLEYPVSGKIGAVVMNPYKIAPLTAVIGNGGWQLSNVKVRIVPKEGGQELKYDVSETQARTHGGIPIFGLYADYQTQVEVSYTKTGSGKSEDVTETYYIYNGPARVEAPGYAYVTSCLPIAEVVKTDPKFSDRLYLINNQDQSTPQQAEMVWNNPVGGSLQWSYWSQIAIYDSTGELRWYLDTNPIFDGESLFNNGFMMGVRQNDDGAFTWGYGMRYVKYDLLGREIFSRRLPMGYSDFSHAMNTMPNGHYLLRVAKSNYARGDGKHVHTVRDVIIEVDADGNVVDEWQLFDIIDPYRDVVMKVLDQGAVCLNLDAEKAGQTLSAEELAQLDESDEFGDIVGTGPGRNWAHVNSVQYDEEDDSIIISSRHQSALIKIGRDKQVKWILGSPEGWKEPFASKVLTPVDSNGNPIKCENSKCEGDFDWTWTQHTGWKVPAKSKGKDLMLSVFDNGDGRGMEQPAMADMKYSRAVFYMIDQEKMTVEQIWEYGKERGHEWYSPITSITEYQPDKDSIVVFSATAGLDYSAMNKVSTDVVTPVLSEFNWGEKEPAVEIKFHGIFIGYQAMPVSLDKAFNGPKK